MRIIPFYSQSLVFRFSKYNRLYLYDYFYLPSKRFLSRIYFYKRKLGINQVVLPSEFELRPESAMIVLNKNSTILSRNVDCIRCRVGIKVVIGSYQDSAEELGEFLIDGNRRMKNGKIWEIIMRHLITGALVYCDESEKEEAIEITSGLLSILTPEEILRRYM